MIPSPLDAVIFDMDGLLLDTETLWRDAMELACAGIDYPMSPQLHLSLIGHPPDVSDGKIMAHYGPDFPLERFRAEVGDHLGRLCEQGVALRPGAAALLDLLIARGIPRAVATSTGRPRAVRHLRQGGVLHLFDAIVTRSEVTHPKPHPESFLSAAALLGARPGHCLALEDSHNGVRAAVAAGMAVVMVPDMLPATGELVALGVTVVDSLEAVATAIAAI